MSHYPRGIAPFSAIVEPTLSAYADLARDLPAGMAARLFRPRNEPTPQDWDTISAHPIIQMVFDRSGSQTPHDMPARVLSLGRDDVPDMLTLADITRPGPFALRTIELGGYVGVRQAATRRLVAMGGERFRLSSHVELSAIAMHPDARGRGLGAAVTAHLTNSALARGLVPFLHVFPSNPAVELYKRLGFRERTRLWVLWRRPIANGAERWWSSRSPHHAGAVATSLVGGEPFPKSPRCETLRSAKYRA